MRNEAMANPSDNNGAYPHLDTHVAVWGNFCTIAKWVVIGSVVGLVLMAAFLTGDHRVIAP
jgi:hypothetical protein